MHRRHEHFNVPIEIVRTVVAISETGSLTKVGERLGLSQPAVSAQMKRIQNFVNERHEPFAWVCSKHFVISPGAPIPLLTWPGDDMMIRALRKNGSTYQIVFNSPD